MEEQEEQSISSPRYRVVVAAFGDGGETHYLARVPELNGCEAEGATRAEALARLEEELDAQLGNIAASGNQVPPPVDTADFSGDLRVKVSPDLHRELVFWARDRGVALETALVEMLARGVAGRAPEGSRGPQRRASPYREGNRGRGAVGQRYHDIMENRADFIEYLRNMDRGATGGAGRRRGGGGRRGRGQARQAGRDRHGQRTPTEDRARRPAGEETSASTPPPSSMPAPPNENET